MTTIIRNLRYTASSIIRRGHRHTCDYLRRHLFATERYSEKLPYIIKMHTLPIYRHLPGVDNTLFEQKRDNLRIAISTMNGVIIPPQTILSLWRLVGSPSKRRGFKEGLSICRGQPSKSIGGGLCQLANAVFWLALHSDLTVIERHRHSLDLFPDDNRRVPFGTGATIVYNYKDLCLHNATTWCYQFCFEITETEMISELRSSHSIPHTYEIVEEGHRFERASDGWYRSNVIVRQQRAENNQSVLREILFKNRCRCQYSPREVV